LPQEAGTTATRPDPLWHVNLDVVVLAPSEDDAFVQIYGAIADGAVANDVTVKNVTISVSPLRGHRRRTKPRIPLNMPHPEILKAFG
jgi:hypothetical protein